MAIIHTLLAKFTLVVFLECSSIAGGRTAAYVSFKGEAIRNNGYVDLGQVGNERRGRNSLQCHTNLDTCCRNSSSSVGGSWFSPGDNIVQETGAVYAVNGDQRVDIRRSGSQGNPQSGIYRCEIDTATEDSNVARREIVYVGLYSNGGGRLELIGSMTLRTRPVGGGYTRFIFTCNTTGGPPTHVVWTTGKSLINDGSKSTILHDAQTSHYTHSLSLTGPTLRNPKYACIIHNEISRVEATFRKGEIVVFNEISVSSTTANVSWNVDRDSISVSSVSLSFSTTNSAACFNHKDEISDIPVSQTTRILTGLQGGTEYTITVTAHQNGGITFSKSISIVTTIDAVPSVAPTSLTVLETTVSSISLHWEPIDCKYRTTGYSVQCSDGRVRQMILVNDTKTVLTGLNSSTELSVSVAAINTMGVGPYSDAILTYTDVAIEEKLSLIVESISPTSATLSWTLSTDHLTATSYSISFSNTDHRDCFTDSANITGLPGITRQYSLTGIQEGTEYTTTLTALLSDGKVIQNSTAFTTVESVPAVGPELVGVTDVTETNITIQWNPINCRYENGLITGYSVVYREEGYEREERMMVLGETTHSAVVTDLTPGTMYSIKIAAVNTAGEGAHSKPIHVASHVSALTNTVMEALTMTGGIGFMIGIALTLLVTVPIVCLLIRSPRNKSRVKKDEEKVEMQEYDMKVADNSAYCSAASALAGNSYQDEIIYEHIK